MECVPNVIHYPLTHLPLVPHICVGELGQHWFRWWLVAWSAPSHYLNQCWNIGNSNLRNKFQWNLTPNSHIVIHENASENIVCEMAILSRGRWVSLFQRVQGSNHGRSICILAGIAPIPIIHELWRFLITQQTAMDHNHCRCSDNMYRYLVATRHSPVSAKCLLCICILHLL